MMLANVCAKRTEHHVRAAALLTIVLAFRALAGTLLSMGGALLLRIV